MSQNGVGCAQKKSSLSSHVPAARSPSHLRAAAAEAGNLAPPSRSSAMCSLTSLAMASDTKVGWPLTWKVTLEATPAATSASARHRSVTSSNPALSTTMSTGLPPASLARASRAHTAPEWSHSSILWEEPNTSWKACAARSRLLPSSPDAAGQMERSMRLPHRAVAMKSFTSVSGSSKAQACASCSLAARASTDPAAALSPCSFWPAKGSGKPPRKYPKASRTRR
mmetsp:Transcript_10780/g.30310  ORF Transcript_10780/g.30310 Transcript_10780/m.30310 type:complete len:225 (-) Transcript_10780:323-997(-)